MMYSGTSTRYRNFFVIIIIVIPTTFKSPESTEVDQSEVKGAEWIPELSFKLLVLPLISLFINYCHNGALTLHLIQ